MISPAALETAKAKIVQVIGDRLPLRKRGATWWTPCPFHAEKTASFAVSESRKRFKCFSCNASGDALDFVRMFHKTDFRGAAATLGAANGEPSDQETKWLWVKRVAEHHKVQLNTEWNQLAAGLRYIGSLIARTEPLERESDWFTAELVLNDSLDELGAGLKK